MNEGDFKSQISEVDGQESNLFLTFVLFPFEI